MTCGRLDGGAEGYWHIKKGHQKHRGSAANMASFQGGKWEEVADLGIAKSVRDPNVFRQREHNNTTCYNRKFLANRRTGESVYALNADVAVSNNNLLIVTACPVQDKRCGRRG